MLKKAVEMIHTYYTNGINDPTIRVQADVLKSIFNWLIKDGELVEPVSTNRQPNSRSSAMRMMYLLQQCIKRNYAVLEKPRISQPTLRKQKFSTNFQLQGVREEQIKTLIGYRGSNIKAFRDKHSCGVTINDDGEDVFATIEKKCLTQSEVDDLKVRLLEYVEVVLAPEDVNTN